MNDLLQSFLLAIMVTGFAFYKKWLSSSGTIAATLMGCFIWYAGKWSTTLPILFFFVSSSFISKLPNTTKYSINEVQTKPRNAIQVLCNGGIACVCLAFYHFNKSNAYWLVGFCTSLAVSMSDTWSSELGSRYGGKTIDILRLKPTTPGISGGVSVIGTIAGFLASLLMAVLCNYLFQLNIWQSLMIVLLGFGGMILDSILGSQFQALYQSSNGSPLEINPTSHQATLIKGFSWMSNNLVNIISNVIITAIALITGMAST
jgi:uncharacterized protein (TIGR00297 family)